MLCLFIQYYALTQYFLYISCIFVIENIYFADTANEYAAVIFRYKFQRPSAKSQEQISKYFIRLPEFVC